MSTDLKLSDARTLCENCPFHKMEGLRPLSAELLDFVRSFKKGELVFGPGQTIYHEASESSHLYTILPGWAFRYKMLEDGRRQILNFALPSDLIGLQNAMFQAMCHSVEALTEVRLCIFNRTEIWSLYQNHPQLAFDLTWIAAREEAILHDHLLSTGRRSGLERVAFVLMHLFERLEKLGLVHENSAVFPIRQAHLADALGLSVVHTNKTIQRLSRAGIIEWRNGVFRLIDRQRLGEIALFTGAGTSLRPFL
jgi:CRP-like cAMP-binding protein